jgi:hypothetical protein
MKELKIIYNEQISEFDYTYSCVTVDDLGLSLETYMDIMEDASKKVHNFQTELKRVIKIFFLLLPAISFVLLLLLSITGILISYYVNPYVGIGKPNNK